MLPRRATVPWMKAMPRYDRDLGLAPTRGYESLTAEAMPATVNAS